VLFIPKYGEPCNIFNLKILILTHFSYCALLRVTITNGDDDDDDNNNNNNNNINSNGKLEKNRKDLKTSDERINAMTNEGPFILQNFSDIHHDLHVLNWQMREPLLT
jgi:hypothetical protein